MGQSDGSLMKNLVSLAALIVLANCGSNSIPTPKLVESPAARYCQQAGGQISIQREAMRGEVGYCHLPNGSTIEEWELFRQVQRR